MSSQKIGQMDPCYFLGRRDILDFVNETCQVQLGKVEQTCNGAIASQLLDYIHPNAVAMHKLDWTATNDYQYMNNYKVLQNAFKKLKIDKPIVVDKLVRGKYQDNLEFMQWFKGYFDLNAAAGSDYDAIGRRSKGRGGDLYSKKYPYQGAPKQAASKDPAASTGIHKTSAKPSGKQRLAKLVDNNNVDELTSEWSNKLSVKNDEITQLQNEVETALADKKKADGYAVDLEKERDYYWDKLRAVELYIQENADSEVELDGKQVTQQILDILYVFVAMLNFTSF